MCQDASSPEEFTFFLLLFIKSGLMDAVPRGWMVSVL